MSIVRSKKARGVTGAVAIAIVLAGCSAGSCFPLPGEVFTELSKTIATEVRD